MAVALPLETLEAVAMEGAAVVAGPESPVQRMELNSLLRAVAVAVELLAGTTMAAISLTSPLGAVAEGDHQAGLGEALEEEEHMIIQIQVMMQQGLVRVAMVGMEEVGVVEVVEQMEGHFCIRLLQQQKAVLLEEPQQNNLRSL
jgi:hypothetical protein